MCANIFFGFNTNRIPSLSFYKYKLKIKYLYYAVFIITGIIVANISCSKNALINYHSSNYNKLRGKPYRVFNKLYYPLLKADNYSEKGIASWYGKDFHGKKTSNGEIYNMYAMTAAHKTLPLGTYVIIHNLENGKKIQVRINDRGPFIDGRIIDLSLTAAKKLNIVNKGTAYVRVTAIPKKYFRRKIIKNPVSKIQNNCYTIQIGAFENIKNAKSLKNKLEKSFNNIFVQKSLDNNGGNIYRVFLGKCLNPNEISHFEKQLAKNGFTDALIKSISKL